MTVSLDQIYSKSMGFVDSAENDLETHLQNMDPNNTADQLKLQMYMQKWSMATQLSTNLMNVVKDANKGVVQNIR